MFLTKCKSKIEERSNIGHSCDDNDREERSNVKNKLSSSWVKLNYDSELLYATERENTNLMLTANVRQHLSPFFIQDFFEQTDYHNLK